MVIPMGRTPLMLVALLGVMNPPGRPPGDKPMGAKSPAITVPATAPCAYRNCQGEGIWQKELAYECNECNKVFYYCTYCRSFYPRGKEGEHEHKPLGG